jgi:hypothetical protein
VPSAEIGIEPPARHRLTAGEARIPKARLVVALGAALGCAGILLMTRGYNFYFDEWDFILAAPDWSWLSFLQPHNEHPSLFPKAIYALLLNTVGLRAYTPYMVVLMLLHAGNVLLLFELVRRRAGDVVALCSAALLLVLGAGWENLLWAFQLGFVGSVTCGLGALLALERPRTRNSLIAMTVLTTGSLMFSGIGLAFAIAAAVHLAVAPHRRRDLTWLVPVALLVLIWYVALGRGGAPANPPPTAANVWLAPGYALWGMGAAAAGIIGEGGWFSPVALVAGAAIAAWSWWRRRPDPLPLAVAAALAGFYLITGLSRAQFGYEQSGAGRYVYEGAILWLILLADAARSLPWRGTWRPAIAAMVFLACFNSGALLFEFATAKSLQMQREGADLQALAAARRNGCASSTAGVDPLVMPQVRSLELYYRAVDHYGDPAPPLPVTDLQDYHRAIANLEQPPCL